MKGESVALKMPEPGKSLETTDDKGNTAIIKNNEQKGVTKTDVQAYYFTVAKILKNYLLYKTNQSLFRESVACDKCYQIHSVDDEMYVHRERDITLCEDCFDSTNKNTNYVKKVIEANEDTGLKWN